MGERVAEKVPKFRAGLKAEGKIWEQREGREDKQAPMGERIALCRKECGLHPERFKKN